MTERNALEGIVDVALDFLAPLRIAVEDERALVALLNQMGWSAPGIDLVQLGGAVDTLVDAVEAVGAELAFESLDDLVATLTSIAAAVDALADFAADLADAAGAAAADPALLAAAIEVLAVDLLQHLSVLCIGRLPVLYSALELLGLIDEQSVTAMSTGGAEPLLSRAPVTRPALALDALGDLISNPVTHLRARLGAQRLTTQQVAEQVARDVFGPILQLVTAAGGSGAVGNGGAEPDQPDVEDIAGRRRAVLFVALPSFPIGGVPASTRLALVVELVHAGGTSSTGDAGPGVLVSPEGTMQVTAALPGTEFTLTISGGAFSAFFPAEGTPVLHGGADGVTIELTFRKVPPAEGAPAFAVGADTAKLIVEGLTAGVRGRFGQSAEPALDLEVESAVERARFVLALSEGDGFLASVLPPDGLTVGFDLAIGWSNRRGVYFAGGAALSLVVPVGVNLGPARVDLLELALRLAEGEIVLGLGLAAGITLGPFSAAVEGVGMAAVLGLRPGNVGPVDLSFRFVPPRGLGLSVKTGPVKGGGFIEFDEPAGRYSGIFELKISVIGVNALGVLDTKLPGGQEGYALLVMLRASFPPIQVGFGIALSAVGGLLALNRRVDVDALRQRFSGGTVGRILSPEDPVRDAALLFTELGSIFPITPGVTVVGPTLQLSWVEVVKLDLGIFIELPGPSKIVLLGSARAALENPSGGRPYLQLRLDIIGVLDFDKKVLEFDATLVDSQLLEVFELTGGAAFRLSWGEQPYVVLSIGGFHPAYNPAPIAFPSSLTRVAMTRGSPTDLLYLRFEGYFAITTNTVQFGAAVQVIVNAGPFRAEGFLGFDALIRFQPFFFQFSFQARVRVSLGPLTLAAVRIEGVLSGPGPITFSGELCLQILFFEIRWRATITIGSNAPPAVQPVPSALPILGAELRRPDNLFTEADDPLVALAPPENATLPVMAPTGPVVWAQKRAPLGLLLQRFEGAPLERHETITAGGSRVTDKALDWFAPGNSVELSKSEAINRRAFERLPGGVKLGSPGDAVSGTVTHPVTMEQYRLGVPPRAAAPGPTPDWLQAALNRRDGVELPPGPPPAITVEEESWTVSTVDGELLTAGLSESQAHQLATANGAVAGPAGDRVAVASF